jgi:glycosyltransferase involved in cell wall biosynthesis
MAIPLVLVGDSPWQPTGLGRIAKDLVTRLRGAVVSGQLPIQVSMVGWQPPDFPHGANWCMGHTDSETWGRSALEAWWGERVDSRELGIVFSIWDPARCYALRQAQLEHARWWGYFPIDGENVRGGIGGPARAAVDRYDRVLAYGRYGARVLGTADHLPHGIDASVFYPRSGEQTAWETLGDILAPIVTPESILVGCVMANQARKDFGLLCETIARMIGEDRRIRLWVHTDQLVSRAWAIPQLVEDFGIARHIVVTTELTDDQLAAIYSWCAVTILPSLGEGFGYPIVESLSCGTPVVHGTYAGGAEHVPHPAWKYPERGRRLESVYAVIRPVYTAEDVANAAWRAIRWGQEDPAIVREYCVGSVNHLHWDRVWPRWVEWFQQGIEELV